jgi:hypothetical protein
MPIMRGTVAKRCSCKPEVDSRGRRKACQIKHGSWGYTVDLGPGPNPTGEIVARRQRTRFGFPTKKDAEQACRVLDANARARCRGQQHDQMTFPPTGWPARSPTACAPPPPHLRRPLTIFHSPARLPAAARPDPTISRCVARVQADRGRRATCGASTRHCARARRRRQAAADPDQPAVGVTLLKGPTRPAGSRARLLHADE